MFTFIRHALPVISAAAIFTPMVASAGEVSHRELHQEQRIFTGVKDNQLTGAEFRNLQRRELSVNAQQTAELRRDDGHLTRQNYQQLNQRLSRISGLIYRDRHN